MRWCSDGGLDFFGRVDFQIKLNGQRIEAGEIEAAMRKVPGVRESTVVLRTSKTNVARLLGYVVPGATDPEQVRKGCAAVLPPYMVPSTVIALEEWPLTLAGKLDTKALPEPGADCLLDCSTAPAASSQALAIVLECIEKLTGVRLHPTQPMMESGFLNSLTAVRLCLMLEVELASSGCKYPRTLVFDFPTPAAIAEYVESETHSAKVETDSPNRHVLPDRTISNRTAAIVAAEGNAPGACDSAKKLWNMVANGHDSLQTFPSSRCGPGITSTDLQDTTRVYHGHFVQSPELFDYSSFGISVLETSATDPEHRLLLESVHAAWTRMCVTQASLMSSVMGVFLGYGPSGWVGGTTNTFSLHGTMVAAIAGRVSYLFGLTGPAVVVDTACSASLVAMDIACQNLFCGACQGAAVGGSSLTWDWPRAPRAALAPDGRSKTFDIAADGLGTGEGTFTAILETFTTDHNCAIQVPSSAVNQDGRSASFAAPNGRAQAALIQGALEAAGLKYLFSAETHGTGTSLGDVIEVGALRSVTGKTAAPLGALKSSIGHAGHTAGLAGTLALAHTLQYLHCPPSLHLRESNPLLELEAWEPILASQNMLQHKTVSSGVSSFGLTGTNAHCIQLPAASLSAIDMQPVLQFEHRRFAWSGLVCKGTPLLGYSDCEAIWERTWPEPTRAFFAGHGIGSVAAMPHSGLTQIAHLAALQDENSSHLNECHLVAALFLDTGTTPTVRVALKAASLTIDACTSAHTWQCLALGTLVAGPVPPRHAVRWAESTTALASLDKELLYSVLGNAHQSGFRSVESVWVLSEQRVLAKATSSLGRQQVGSWEEHMHLQTVAWIEACAQSGVLTNDAHCGQPHVTSTVMRAIDLPTDTEEWWCFVDAFGVTLYDGHTQEAVGGFFMSGLQFLAVGALDSARVAQNAYSCVWNPLDSTPTPLPEERGAHERWLWDTGETLQRETLWGVCLTTLQEICVALGSGTCSQLLLCPYTRSPVASSALRLLQQLLVSHSSSLGVVFVSPLGPATRHTSSGLLGLVNCANTELPSRLVCSYTQIAPTASSLVGLIQTVDQSKLQCTVRVDVTGHALALQLQRCPLSHSCTFGVPGRKAVLTGGTGGIGMLLSSWFTSHKFTNVSLLSRSTIISEGAEAAWYSISALHSSSAIGIEICDVSHSRELTRAVHQTIPTTAVHCAGGLGDALLGRQTQASFRYVWGCKAHTAWNLHGVASTLQDLLLCSSDAALLGSEGQVNYAAANGSLDDLAQLRHAEGLNATSVQWGGWATAGMGVRSRSELRRAGKIPPEGKSFSEIHGMVSQTAGHAVLELCLSGGSPSPVIAVTPLSWPKLTDGFNGIAPPILTCLAAQYTQFSPSTRIICSEKTLPTLTLSEVTSRVSECASSVAKSQLSANESLMEQIDSLATIELRHTLADSMQGWGCPQLATSDLFEFPTVSELAQHIFSQHISMESAWTNLESTFVSVPSLAGERAISLSGMACTLAGGAKSPSGFWNALCSGCCLISTRDNTLTAAFLEDPPLEASVDKHLSLLITCAVSALSDASCTATELGIGTFTAIDPMGMSEYLPDYMIARLTASALMNRGPLMNINAECSSGYLAVFHAATAVMRAECDTAVVAAVSLLLEPDQVAFGGTSGNAAYLEQFYRKMGKMMPLDGESSEVICGEGCAAVVLTTCPAEQEYCQLTGWAANHTSTAVSPGFADAHSMEQAATKAFLHAGITGRVAVTHLHAMGRKGSDEPEAVGVIRALSALRGDSTTVLAGHKACTGHTIAASGIVSVIATATVLEHRRVPRHLNVRRPFKSISEASDIVHLPIRSSQILPMGPLNGSISGTSISGDNVHLVLQHSGQQSGVFSIGQNDAFVDVKRSLELAGAHMEVYQGMSNIVNSATHKKHGDQCTQQAHANPTTMLQGSPTTAVALQTIREVCASVLDRRPEDVGLDMNLLKMGLSSLGAALMRQKLQATGLHGLNSVGAVLQHPTINQLHSLALGSQEGTLGTSIALLASRTLHTDVGLHTQLASFSTSALTALSVAMAQELHIFVDPTQASSLRTAATIAEYIEGNCVHLQTRSELLCRSKPCLKGHAL